MKANLIYVSEMRFAYTRRIGAYGSENAQLMENMKNWMKRNQMFNDDTVIYGIARDNSQIVPPEACRYDVGMVVSEDFNNSELEIGTIPAGKYLVFTIAHTQEAVQNFWHSIFDILKCKEQQWDVTRDILERYAGKLIEKGLCEFCIPIQ